MQTYGVGDQLIHVNIWTPKELSDDDKKLLGQMKESKNFDPLPGKFEKGFFDRMKDYFN